MIRRFLSGEGLRAQLARGALRGLVVTMLGILVGFLVQVVKGTALASVIEVLLPKP